MRYEITAKVPTNANAYPGIFLFTDNLMYKKHKENGFIGLFEWSQQMSLSSSFICLHIVYGCSSSVLL